ncbi:MAG: type III pantothenate kinase [Deltaproteobacteria bacterium]|nr:type III pantothenate kinase [Deltaproteobacteria bacterium]
MLLAIDIGNTNIVFGLFRDDELLECWRMETRSGRTEDEYAVFLNSLLSLRGFSLKDIKCAAISCVVPPLQAVFESLMRRYTGAEPLVVGPGIKTGVSIHYENPREVGADRIVNAVAAWERYRCSVIVVDFGTATTFDAISEKGEYLGGAITPGINISLDALFIRAAKLPRVEFAKPKSVIGKNTPASIQSGVFYGYIGVVDGIVERMKEELPKPVRVIATGGLAGLIAPETKSIGEVDPLLTLHGLRIIYRKNCV